MRFKLFELWMDFGVRMGWISPPYCMIHEDPSYYYTDEEMEVFEGGSSPCHTIMSLIEYR